ncbi:hypothetical protein [Lacihabitans lacunae]|uniref:DUF3997 domain-containing protein n=1 Tax=Lacihabitans lacunae TaxID=1028214 RepID=A0ABV7Z0K8_9BACT
MQIGSKKNILYLTINTLIVLGCVGRDYSLHIVNNCEYNFDYIISSDSLLVNAIDMYIDSDITKSPESLNYEVYTFYSKANSTDLPIGHGEDYWKKIVKKSKQKKMYVFLFKEELLKRNTWPVLVKNNIYTKLISISEKQLIDNNWYLNICK